jgi:hypothetical protein
MAKPPFQIEPPKKAGVNPVKIIVVAAKLTIGHILGGILAFVILIPLWLIGVLVLYFVHDKPTIDLTYSIGGSIFGILSLFTTSYIAIKLFKWN